MATITFDTRAYSQKIQKSGVPREQAEAMAQANADSMRDIININELVTKKDLEFAFTNTKHVILMWMVMAIIAQTALLVGIIAFLK